MSGAPNPWREGCPFQTSDVVRCIRSGGSGVGLEVGQVYTVGVHFETYTAADPHWRVSINENDNRWYHDTRCLELVTNPGPRPETIHELITSMVKSRPKRRKNKSYTS